MPEGHPLFLFSIDGRTWLSAVQSFHWILVRKNGRRRMRLGRIHYLVILYRMALFIFYGAIYWGSFFSVRNEKMGLDGAMVHLEG